MPDYLSTLIYKNIVDNPIFGTTEIIKLHMLIHMQLTITSNSALTSNIPLEADIKPILKSFIEKYNIGYFDICDCIFIFNTLYSSVIEKHSYFITVILKEIYNEQTRN